MEKEFEQEQRKGYIFGGWYIDPQRTKRLNPGGILPAAVTLYDKWIPIWYKIHYDLQGGMNSRMNPQFLNIESGVLPLYPARKAGMIFDYWTLNGEKISVIPEQMCEEIVLVAHYRKRCEVNFETNGGAFVQPQLVDGSGYLNSFRPPMKIGHTFIGWFWDPDFKRPFSFEQKIRESCTLYAAWDETIFTITYRANGGISSRKNPHIYTYDSPDIELLPAYKKGYIFIGWFDARNNPIARIPRHSIGDKVLFAHYKEL